MSVCWWVQFSGAFRQTLSAGDLPLTFLCLFHRYSPSLRGASPSWVTLGLFVCLSAFGAGGNLVLDTTVFLEYLPGKEQWLLTLMAAWWGELTLPSTSSVESLN